ncbi:MAG: alkaline phosphatase family protein, partial [Candidatus Binatia bacterium]
QRLVVAMYDGLCMDYLRASAMPAMNDMMARGLFKQVAAVFPTVTNVNNVSICCSAWPAEHGITGNSYYNEVTGEADYMEDADFIRLPTLFQRAAQQGVRSALLTCKNKTIRLLGQGTAIAVAAETPPAEYVDRYGPPPHIYSREINYWLWKVATDLLKQRPDIQLLYVHTTDYPMHTWAPQETESQEHLARLDALLGEASAVAPDAAFFLTADHGMNYKTRCWDLARACRERGVALRFALSVEKDRYIKHHRTFGGTAWVWLHAPREVDRVRETIGELEGVEVVLTREEAASRFHLMPERIGDVVVIGDLDTVFGDLPTSKEDLEPGYRSHGSLYERDIPLVIFNYAGALPPAVEIQANLDLTRTLYRELSLA